MIYTFFKMLFTLKGHRNSFFIVTASSNVSKAIGLSEKLVLIFFRGEE